MDNWGDQLYTLVNKNIMDEESSPSVKNAMVKGSLLYKNYKQHTFISRENSIYNPLTQSNVKFFCEKNVFPH